MAKGEHAKYVNTRLSSARQLLSECSGLSLEPSKLLHTALIDSAVLQTRLAFLHYVNELLGAYRHETFDSNTENIANLFAREKQVIPEFVEYYQLLEDSHSWLSLLLAYPDYLLAQATVEEEPVKVQPLPKNLLEDEQPLEVSVQKPATKSNTLTLISVSDIESSSLHPLTLTSALWVIDQCWQCIQRQREHLIEC